MNKKCKTPPSPWVTCSSSYHHCCPHLVSSKGWVGLVIVSLRDGFGDERCTPSRIHSSHGLVIMVSTISTQTALPCRRDSGAVGQIKALAIIISFWSGRLGPHVCELLPSLERPYILTQFSVYYVHLNKTNIVWYNSLAKSAMKAIMFSFCWKTFAAVT